MKRKIRDADLGLFDDQGNPPVKDWTGTILPEDSVDVLAVDTGADGGSVPSGALGRLLPLPPALSMLLL